MSDYQAVMLTAIIILSALCLIQSLALIYLFYENGKLRDAQQRANQFYKNKISQISGEDNA